MEDKEKPLVDTENDKKRFANKEAKRILAEKEEAEKELSEKQKVETGRLAKFKMKFSHLGKWKLKKKPSDNVKPELKSNVQLKAFKFAKDASTGEIVPDIRLKEGQLRGHVLVVDYYLDENSFKDEILIMIKKAGVDSIIAPGFVEPLCKKAADIGLHLMKCSHTKLIEEGNNIEFYRKEGVVFDVDNGQEYKFQLMNKVDPKN